ncbi:MAG: tetratricopeptide repeat protein [Burkholderiaceae bacterium]|nr:tetratricopeptide repeat protein [Burkholderiaceae bacterium]
MTAPGQPPAPGAPASAHLSLFGPPILRVDDHDWVLPTNRRGQLLALLAAHADWVRRDQLATWLWPDHTQAAARVNLRNLLLRSRQLLAAMGAPALQEQGDALRWPVASDWQQFRADLAQGRWSACLAVPSAPLIEGMDAQGNDVLDEVLRRLRGEADDGWRRAVAQQLELQAHDPDARAELARRLLERDPLDEDAMLLRLRALHDAGQAGQAEQALQRYAQRLHDQLGIGPSLTVQDAARPRQAPAPPPAARAVLLGRDAELQTLRDWLTTPDARLLSVVALGGMGKSALAQALCREVMADADVPSPFLGWVAFEPAADLASAWRAFAQALSVTTAPRDDMGSALLRQLAQRRGWLVLDGVEHLADALAPWLATLLDSAPALRVLVTSRVRLGVPGEAVLTLGPLALPAADRPATEAAAAPAVAMFERTAAAVQPGYDTAGHRRAAATIVRALEGIPLAIELAATWVSTLGVEGVLAALNEPLVLLTDASDLRGRSLGASLARSWALLAPSQAAAMGRLAWLPGPFDHRLAAAVADVPLALLRSLVDRSLVRVDADGRFTLHALVRSHAQSQAPAARKGVQRRHARLMAERVEQLAQHPRGSSAPIWATDWPHLLAAWRWGVAERDTAVLQAMAQPFTRRYFTSGPLPEGLGLLHEALATAPEHAHLLRMELHVGLGWLNDRAGHPDEAQQHGRAALALGRQLRAHGRLHESLRLLGGIAMARLELDRAARYLAEALRSGERHGIPRAIMGAASGLGAVLRMRGDLAGASAQYERAMAVAQQHPDLAPAEWRAGMLNNLGSLYREMGDAPRALETLAQALAMAQDLGAVASQGYAALNLALTHGEAGDWAQAADWAARAHALAEAAGERTVALRAEALSVRALLQGAGPARWRGGRAGAVAGAGRALRGRRASRPRHRRCCWPWPNGWQAAAATRRGRGR